MKRVTPCVDFSRVKWVLDLPYLIEVQKKSYEWFLKEGLMQLFQEISPIQDFSGHLLLEFVDYSLGEPKWSEKECKDRDVTYAAPLRVKVRLIHKETGEVKEQEVFMGDFPLMTDRGTFIINGAERVVVSQLVRSPGLYCSREMDTGGGIYYVAQVIPNRGAWLELDSTPNGVVYVRLERTRRLPATTLLRALGYETDAQLLELLGDDELVLNTLEKDPSNSARSALLEIYKRQRPGEPLNEEAARSLLDSLFFDPRRFNLAPVGRYKLNKKLSLRSRLIGQWAAEDVISPLTGEVLVRAGDRISRAQAERIEEAGITRVRVRTPEGKVATVLSNGSPGLDVRVLTREDVAAVVNYVFNLFRDIGTVDDIDHLGNRRLRSVGELLQNQFRLGLNRMERVIRERMTIQGMEAVTPQALINIRPVVAAVKEFFGSSQLSQFMDQTNPLSELTHKRRLSALGPGGLSRERAGFEVRDVHHSHYGRMCPIETPEGPNIGLIGAMSTYARVNDFGFLETPYRRVKDGRVTEEVVYLMADEEDDYVIAEATTPLDEEGNILPRRVTARVRHEIKVVPREEVELIDVSPNQLVSVATALIPFLEHDDANRALMGANMQRQAVPLLVTEPPLVGTGIEKRVARDSGVLVLARRGGQVERVTADEIVIRTPDGERDSYHLQKFMRSNQGTCFNQKPIVRKGDQVEAGQVIADGACTSQGELALGRNVLVAIMPWEGYNYEDAILISERLVRDDVFTSIHIEEHECEARDTNLGPEEITREIPHTSEEILKDLDERGIVRIGAEVRAGDILVGKTTPKGEGDLTAEERLLRAIFGEKARDMRDTSLRVPHGESGIVVGVKVFSREEGDELSPGVNQLIRVYVAQKRKISVGDKMAGRHGNKGVIAKILPPEDMPFLPDGTPVDIVLNPLGVPSRMNLGQVLEASLGLAARTLGFRCISPAFAGATEDDIRELLRQARKKQEEEGGPVWIDESGKTILYDGRTGEPFHAPVAVGYMYMLKLAHLVDDKIHARSTGPYSLVTQQPLGGKAQFGGQRFGEMEVWALEAYGSAYTLQELLTVKSDDTAGRVKTYEAIIKGDNIPEPGVPESFKVLIKEMQSLGLDVRVLSEDEKEIEIRETVEEEAPPGEVGFEEAVLLPEEEAEGFVVEETEVSEEEEEEELLSRGGEE